MADQLGAVGNPGGGQACNTGKPGVCFIITGPGSPSVLSNMVPSIEQHANWIAGCLAWMGARGLRRALEFMVPYIRDRKSWPLPPDGWRA